MEEARCYTHLPHCRFQGHPTSRGAEISTPHIVLISYFLLLTSYFLLRTSYFLCFPKALYLIRRCNNCIRTALMSFLFGRRRSSDSDADAASTTHDEFDTLKRSSSHRHVPSNHQDDHADNGGFRSLFRRHSSSSDSPSTTQVRISIWSL